MNTKQMEYILELSRTKNFNRAAENLYISQPALTYQIKTVEEEIGFKIFERSGKGVFVTPAGEQFTIALQDILNELNHAIEQGVSQETQFTQTVTVGLPMLSTLSYLPEAMQRQKELHPTTPITAKFDPPGQMLHPAVTDTDIRFFLHASAARQPGVREYALYESKIYAVVPEGHPFTKKEIIQTDDLKSERVAVYSGRFPTIMRYIYQQVQQIRPRQLVLAPDLRSIFLIVESRSAISVLPGFFNGNNTSNKWIPLDVNRTIPCSLITRANETRESVLDVIHLLQQIYKEHENEPL